MGVRVRAILAALMVCAALPAAAAAQEQPWRDPDLPPGERADALLAAMSSDQKIAMALNDFASVAELGVPALSWADGPSGIRVAGTTSFPSAQVLAASFDRDLARAYGDAIAAEARGKGFNWWLGTAMDIARTPLAGRQPENVGEDPFLAAGTVAPQVLAAKRRHVIATLKHYVANNFEWERIGLLQPPDGATRSPGLNVEVSERALQELYAAPFKRVSRETEALSVMCSYNRLRGLQACENPALLSDLKASGFEGFVVPDFGFAIRDPLAAALAGTDSPALLGAGGRTREMFTSGQISQARLDDIVRRILFAIFDSGAFDDPLPATPAEDVSTPEHRALATRVAQDGTVLLKNARRALPLDDARLDSLAVIGPAGEDAVFFSGGSSGVAPEEGEAVTPAAGIAARAGAGVGVETVQGSLGDVPLPTIVPGSALSPPDGGGAGLRGTYWTNGDFAGDPALTRVDETVDITGSPSGFSPLWSARWEGTLTPPESGKYRFSLLQAGIAELWIGDRLLTRGYRETNQFIVGPQYPLQATVELTAGQPVPIRIKYTSKAQLFGPQVHLAWQLPSASGIGAAVEAARRADAAIVVANNAQGEGMDRASLELAGDQDELISAVAAVNPRTIVVLNTGGPVLMPWLDDVEAVVQAWYPGERFGAALAGVLFGDRDPGGRLPVTFPASAEQGPAPPSRPERYPGVDGTVRYDEGLLVGYRWFDATGQEPLFAFGHGLSYARFKIGGLRVKARHRAGKVVATARVENVSRRPGSTVVQAYLTFPRAAGEPPRQLRGYEKVRLEPGRSARVTFELGAEDLSVFDEGAGDWATVPGRYVLSVGSSSRDLAQRASFRAD
jgi:beta-glucosidase